MAYQSREPSLAENRLYGDLAWLWPILSDPAHYCHEAAAFCDAIRGHASIPTTTLLDLGCGGGHNDLHLKQDFQITGVDLSAGMLGHARRLNPEVTYVQGDLRTVRLGTACDAVIIADAIDYMLTESDLAAAFANAHTHLRPGGVFCTYAEHTREHFVQNQNKCWTRSREEVEVTFLENHYDPDASDATFEGTFVYLIRERGQLRIETDRHLLGLFDLPTWRRLLAAAGFEVVETTLAEEDEPPIPMFICKSAWPTGTSQSMEEHNQHRRRL
jgi:SAM-dependent methyltransferase